MSAKPTSHPKTDLQENHTKSFTIPMPKSYTPILIFLLIIAAFFMGMLITKIQYLQSSNGSGTTAGTYGTQPQAQAPNQPNQPQAPLQKQNVAVGHFPPQGNKDAKVKIIEFGDLRCPFCDQFFKQTEPQIIKDYVDTGKAVFYFRQYAFLGPASTVAANAAECANEQGKFWEMHNYLYQNQPDESDTSMYTTDKLTQIAGTLGMDTNQFNSCLSANKYSQNVSDDLAAGQKAGVSGTPTVFINGTPIVGAQPYSAFQSAIETALK